jgi:RHS repeat-associated protein
LASLSYNSGNNRVTSANFEYDPASNQTKAVINSSGTVQQQYRYDAAGRLAQVLDGGGATLATYSYGASNQRLMSVEGAITTYYGWDGGQVIAEYAPSGRLITDGATGAVLTEQVNLPFGTALTGESSGEISNRRFTSYDRSARTGMDYAVNRFYSAAQGRFTQVDPIGMRAVSLSDPQSLNLYSYVANDPVNFVDPSGLFLIQLCGSYDWGYCDDTGCHIISQQVCILVDTGGWTGPIGPYDPPQGGGGGGGGGSGSGGRTNNEPKPCPPTGRTSIWNGNVTTNKPTIEVGAAIGGVIGGLPGALIGAAVGSMFGVGVNVSYVPSTNSWYAGPIVVFAPGFGGGTGGSISRLSVPSSQNPNSVASGLGLTATFQPLPLLGSTVLKSPGNGPAVVGSSMGSRVPVSFGAGYNFAINKGRCQ